MTKQETLEIFCTLENYEGTKLEGETKSQFYIRRRNEIGRYHILERVRQYIEHTREQEKLTAIASDLAGLDI